MSWNVTLNDIDPAQLGKLAHDAYEDLRQRHADDAEVLPAMNEQFDAALAAASSGMTRVVGKGKVNVTLSGHANPRHEPREGWANDYVSVHVSSVVT